MKNRHLAVFAAFSGALCVGIGAFAAHGLKAVLSEKLMDVMQTGVQYQFYHTLALLLVCLFLQIQYSHWLKISGYCFAVGIVLFSGSLYLFALVGAHGLGLLTPLGGLAFILGWVVLGMHFYKAR
jgi:uncharacterized membrane protein YgdD (TMEM256/DUF423 family)